MTVPAFQSVGKVANVVRVTPVGREPDVTRLPRRLTLARRATATAVLSVSAALALSCAALAPAAGAATPPTTTTTTAAATASPDTSLAAADPAEALGLTDQIAAQGRRLDQLAEAADAAQIQLTQIKSEVSQSQRALLGTQQSVNAATVQVRNQAVSAYIGQPPPSLAGLRMDPNAADAIAFTYETSVAQMEQQSIDHLKSLRAEQGRQLLTLHAGQSEAVASLAQLRAKETQAQKLQAAQETLLASVQGHLAVLVAADQRSEQ